MKARASLEQLEQTQVSCLKWLQNLLLTGQSRQEVYSQKLFTTLTAMPMTHPEVQAEVGDTILLLCQHMRRNNKKAIAEYNESGVLEFIADNYIYSC